MNAKPTSKRPRRSLAETVLDEVGIEDSALALDQHLAGCLGAYQLAGSPGPYQKLPRYGTAVYFALEAIWGIGRYKQHLAKVGKIAESDSDPDWGIRPTHLVNVPWIWVCALVEAWDRYKRNDMSIGCAFGLEGSLGKRPIRRTLDRILNQMAIALWIADRLGNARAAGQKMKVEGAINLAADEFHASVDSIRRIWKKHGRRGKLIVKNRGKTSGSL